MILRGKRPLSTKGPLCLRHIAQLPEGGPGPDVLKGGRPHFTPLLETNFPAPKAYFWPVLLHPCAGCY